jgi:hypothetical protein
MRVLQMSLCAAVLAAASGSMGQTRPGDTMVDVPFAFLVNGQPCPPGITFSRLPTRIMSEFPIPKTRVPGSRPMAHCERIAMEAGWFFTAMETPTFFPLYG